MRRKHAHKSLKWSFTHIFESHSSKLDHTLRETCRSWTSCRNIVRSSLQGERSALTQIHNVICYQIYDWISLIITNIILIYINQTLWGPHEREGLRYHGIDRSAWTAPPQSCETSCTEDRWSPEKEKSSVRTNHVIITDQTVSLPQQEKKRNKLSICVTSEVWSWLRSVLGCSDSAFWEPPFPGV